jgi:hypothetical protein
MFSHLDLTHQSKNQFNLTGGGGGGGGGAVDVIIGLHLAPVEAPVAVAGGAYERLGGALRPQRHELAAPVHGVPADGGRVVALALPVVHHLCLLPLRRGVRHGWILLRTHSCRGDDGSSSTRKGKIELRWKRRSVLLSRLWEGGTNFIRGGAPLSGCSKITG